MTPTALITGASSGIGEAAAKGLLSAGYIVYAGARRVERMQTLADAGARLLALDVTDDASMSAAVKTIVHETGRIDVLVNNAGYGSFGALEDVPLEEARRQFDVNIFGLARLIQLVLPTMRGAALGPNRQCLFNRRRTRTALRQLVPRHEVRARRSQRLVAHGTASVRPSMWSSFSQARSSPNGTALRARA